MPQIFQIKRNDTRPAIQPTLSAAAADVFTSVKFYMKNDSGTVKVNANGAIISQPSATSGGVVKYQWIAADTDTAGHYRGEFQVTFNDGRVETYPNDGYINIQIVDDIV